MKEVSPAKTLEPAVVIWVLSLAIIVGCTLFVEKGEGEPSTKPPVSSAGGPASWLICKLIGLIFWLSHLSVSSVLSVFSNIFAQCVALLRRGIHTKTDVSSPLGFGSGSSPATAVTQAVSLQDRILQWLLGRVFDYSLSTEDDEIYDFIIKRIIDFIMAMRLLCSIPGSIAFSDEQLDTAEDLLLLVALFLDDWHQFKGLFPAFCKSFGRQVRMKLVGRFVKHPLISLALNRLMSEAIV